MFPPCNHDTCILNYKPHDTCFKSHKTLAHNPFSLSLSWPLSQILTDRRPLSHRPCRSCLGPATSDCQATPWPIVVATVFPHLNPMLCLILLGSQTLDSMPVPVSAAPPWPLWWWPRRRFLRAWSCVASMKFALHGYSVQTSSSVARR